MRQWKRLGVGVKFVVVSTLLLTLLLGLSMYHQILLQERHMRDQLVEQAEQLGRFVSVISPKAILSYDFDTLNSFVAEVSQQPDLVYALVQDKVGITITSYVEMHKPVITSLLAHYGKPKVESVAQLHELVANNPRLVTLTFPILHDHRPLGEVIVAVDTERQQGQIRHMMVQQVLEYLAVMLLLGVGIYAVFHYYVLRPVRAIGRGAGRIAEGDYSTPIVPMAEDEIGRLTDNINQMMRDIAQEQSALRKLSSAVEQSPASVIITNTGGIIEYVNRAFVEITGISAESALGKTPRILKSGLTPDHVYADLWNTITAGRVWTGELHNRRGDGRLYWEFVTIAPVRNERNVITHYVAVKEDISVRKEYEERLFRQANFDPLTGLPNRALAMDRLQQMLRTAHRGEGMVVVMFLDLDNFKNINDTLGHETGDRLLLEVGNRLASAVRENDTVARLGGDEFLILLSECKRLQDGEAVAEKMLSVLNHPVSVAGRELLVTPSIGMSLYPRDGVSVDLLLRNADAAMYQAKAAGRNTYRHYTAELNAQIQARLELEAELRFALERQELRLAYQPLVDPRTRLPVGAEVLLRWNNPRLGEVPPEEFIPLAEELGLIVEIGRWVLEQGCHRMRLWQQEHGLPLTLAVNISSRQVCSGELLGLVRQVLYRNDFDPALLELEITEHLLLDNSGEVRETLNGLRSLGVRLSIDDFGTGYSALNYLKRFPLNVLKIDRSFVSEGVNKESDATLIRSIVGMARGLGLEVVGEGVESSAQHQLMLECGVDRLQGFLFSRPLGETDFSAYLGQQLISRPQPAPVP